MAYTHSGSFFLSGDQSGALKYFSPKVSNLTTLQAHREACRAISFSPNDEKFATGGDDGAVKVWSFGAAAEERVLSGGSFREILYTITPILNLKLTECPN
jgi:polyadenylation factor subunit 2